MYRTRSTEEKILHAVGLYVVVPAIVLSALFLFRELKKEIAKPTPQAPTETASETSAEPSQVPTEAEISESSQETAAESVNATESTAQSPTETVSETSAELSQVPAETESSEARLATPETPTDETVPKTALDENVATPLQDAPSDRVATESATDSQTVQETSTPEDAQKQSAKPNANAEKPEKQSQDASKSWEEPSSRKAGERQTLMIDGVEYAFRWIPPGTFTMGSPKSEEGRNGDEKQHKVNIDYGFWMLETEVTREMFIHGEKSRFPIAYVTWRHCQEYVKKLNEREECPQGFEFRLPTEEEWEYACRAGTKTAFSFGDSVVGDCMNCDGRPPYDSPALVGKYPPNPWGLYDMHGNVEEWTATSRFHEYRGGKKFTEEEPGTSFYIIRGGGWKSAAQYCRSAYRNDAAPNYLGKDLGLRIVLSKIPQ